MAFPLEAANDTVLLNTQRHTHVYAYLYGTMPVSRIFLCVLMEICQNIFT